MKNFNVVTSTWFRYFDRWMNIQTLSFSATKVHQAKAISSQHHCYWSKREFIHYCCENYSRLFAKRPSKILPKTDCFDHPNFYAFGDVELLIDFTQMLIPLSALNIPRCTHDKPPRNHDIQQYIHDIPRCNENPQSTDDISPMHWIPPMYWWYPLMH